MKTGQTFNGPVNLYDFYDTDEEGKKEKATLAKLFVSRQSQWHVCEMWNLAQ